VMLVAQPRLALVDAEHLVDGVADEEAAVQRRDLRLGQRQDLAVQVGQRLRHEGPSGRGGPASGSVIVTSVPCPRSLCRLMAPPWASTILRVVARPRPVPPFLVEKNGRNALASTSAAMPLPVSISIRF